MKDPVGSEMTPLSTVLWKDPWEPFYIVRNNAPLYDERFKQYGYNRISQVCIVYFNYFVCKHSSSILFVHTQNLKFP